MENSFTLVKNGSVTSPKGFIAGATYCGIKTAGEDKLDLGILVSELPATAAGTFTSNKLVSPSVTLSKKHVANGSARVIIANSGCANCSVGTQGMSDAEEMTKLAAEHVGVTSDQVLVCSTGLIGVELPMALVRQNIQNISLSNDGGSQFARSIMTTDTRSKKIAVSVEMSGYTVIVGGVAKGVGMIHPNMATMLSFISTDAAIEKNFLDSALKQAVDISFNMIDVDGDQSTNDTVLVLSNGAAGGDEIRVGSADSEKFQSALNYVCTYLAKELVRDGEGAQRLIEIVVEGAESLDQARTAARGIASSMLVKAMVHGGDPNWGRIMVALGQSGINFEEANVDIYANDIHLVHCGVAFPYLKEAVVNAVSVPEVRFNVNVNQGLATATAWGCDLTQEYVIFNSIYST